MSLVSIHTLFRAFRAQHALALLVALISVVACSSSDSSRLTLYRLDRMSGPSEPEYILYGSGGQVDVWLSGGVFREARYASSDGATQVRVIGDSWSGDPIAFVDDTTGQYILPAFREDGGVDFSHYDASGQWLDGYSVFKDGDAWKMGRVIGAPAFEGQIQGQFESTKTGQTGSFAVVAASTADTLTDVRDVTEEMNALLAAMTASPWQSSFENGIGQAVAPLSLGRTIMLGGAILIGGAVTTVLAPAYGAAGVAMIASGIFSDNVADFIEERFASDDPFAQALVETAASNLREPKKTPVESVMSRIIEKVKNLVASESPPRVPEAIVEEYPNDIGNATPSGPPPAPTSGPPAIPTDVTGQAVWQDNSTQQITGTVGADGQVSLNGVGDDPSDTLEVTGQTNDTSFSGTYERGDDQGTATGQVTNVAECQATQGSGGQGTFTNAHYVGSGTGTVSFFYDAYDIPDAFSVSVAGKKVFTTGGLVSGSGTTPIPIKGEGFVFVSVSAPEAGTAWEYSLSCLQ